MLKISNITWMHKEFTNLTSLAALLKDSMKKELKLNVNIQLIDKSVVFAIIKEDKLMVSLVKNKIVLPKDSKRAKELERDYLHSERPTEKQYTGFFSTIQTTLDNLGVSADVVLIGKGGTPYVLREQKVTSTFYPKATSYPVEA